MSKLIAVIATIALTGCASMGDSVRQPVGEDKVVYHLNAGTEQASNGIMTIPPLTIIETTSDMSIGPNLS